jgi:predicted DNA-binding transcriptional regulator YafY
MTRPTTRVLAVLELLQAHHRLGGAELAERVGVDRRTLRRYIAALEDMGVPIVAERGRFGAYGLIAGYKLPPMMFTDDEALALSVGLLAARGLGLADAAPATASAQAKLERVMPRALQKRAQAIEQTVAIDLSRPIAPADNRALLHLTAAAQTRQRVRLSYRAPDGHESERDFDTYGLAYRAGRWYAVGHCHLRRALRSFRLDRTTGVQPLPVSFARPEHFDALAHLRDAVASLPRRHAIDVWLDTTLDIARQELFSAIGLLQPLPRGVRLIAQADDLDWFARELARLPFDYEVVSPQGLRDALRVQGRRLQALAKKRASPRDRVSARASSSRKR